MTAAFAWVRRNRWVLGAALLSLVLTVQPFRDSDVWWHLAAGRYTIAHGIPAAEPFSFLHAANPWSGPQWLYEVFLVRAVDLGGPGLASLVMGVVASAALLVAVLSIPPERRPAGPWMACALLLSALVAAQLVGVRGQVISLLGAAIVLHVLMRWRRGSARALWVLPPVFALWANLHGGFVIGCGILLIALLTTGGIEGGARRRLAAFIVVSAAATLLNPAGPRVWDYLTLTVGNSTLTGLVTEWQPPDFHVTWLRLFEAQAMLLVVAWVLARRRDLFDVLLAGAVFAGSLEAQRNVSLFAIVAAPQLAMYGADAWAAHRSRLPRIALLQRWRRPPRLFGATVLAVVVAGTAAALAPQLTTASAGRFEATHEPRAAADYAASHLAGRRLYTVDTWGGYLAYRFPTGRVVFLYDETTVFGETALQQYLDIHGLKPSWSRVVREAGISAAVLPATAAEVAALFTLGWSVDCRDAASASVVMAPTAATEAPGDAGPAIESAPACG